MQEESKRSLLISSNHNNSSYDTSSSTAAAARVSQPNGFRQRMIEDGGERRGGGAPSSSSHPSPPTNTTAGGAPSSSSNGNQHNNSNTFSDGLYKEQLYRRLDEGIAATIVRRWDNAGGKPGSSPTPVSKIVDSRSHSASSSIFEKYRDNLVGGNNNSSSAGGGGESGAGAMTGSSSSSYHPSRSNASPIVDLHSSVNSGGRTSSSNQSGGGTMERGGKEKDHKYLGNMRSTVIRGNSSSSSSGHRHNGGSSSTTAADGSGAAPHKADINHLLSSDAEKFMDFTMSSPPNQQLLQLRVLELFQIWVSTDGVKEGIDRLLQDARRDVGLSPVTVQQAAWSEELASHHQQQQHHPRSNMMMMDGDKDMESKGENVGSRTNGAAPSTRKKEDVDEDDEEPLHPEALTGAGGGGSSISGGAVSANHNSALPEDSSSGRGSSPGKPHVVAPSEAVHPASSSSSTNISGSSANKKNHSESTTPSNGITTTNTTSTGGGVVGEPSTAPSPLSSSVSPASSPSLNPAEGAPTATATTAATTPSVSPQATTTRPSTGSPAPPNATPPPTSAGGIGSEKDPAPTVVTLTKKALTQHQQQQQQQQSPPQQQQSPTAAAGEGGKSSGGGATYEEIPRFYFPLGKPTTKEKVISGPLYKHHENPHLKFPNADLQSQSQVLFGSEGSGGLSGKINTSMHSTSSSTTSASGGSSNAKGGAKAGGGGSKIPAMSTLRFADDRHVASYIKKEFTRLNGPNRHQKTRLSSTSRRSTSSKEGQFRNHFHQCMQRICSQCFGVPRYFAFIIIGLIQGELCASEEYTNLTGSVKGGVPFISPQCYSVITADHVQDFYEKYLRHKDTLRRTFDLLILSSRLSNSGISNGEVDDAKKNHNNSSTSTVAADPSTLRAHLIAEDFKAYLLTLLCHHPGLAFLRQTPDFQQKYLDTVIYRIFYEIDRFDHGGISFAEFITSALMDAFRQVDATDDINSVLLFFSYEHFYVLYCRFWELDDDRDMLLSPQDLMRYAPDDAMNPLVVQRVFSGAGRRVRCGVKNRIGYEDFVWFCLSEEDKSTAPAIRYWFKVLDIDEDGILSVYEIKNFYDTTTAKVAQYLQDNAVSFENAICQIFDMLRCQEYRGLTLADLLVEPMASYVALNMITSMVKFIQFEYKDPFVLHQDRHAGSIEQSPWDRFARIEYDRMAQEGDD